VNSRWENDGLSDHLALGVVGDVDGVTSRARRPADKVVVVRGCPAAVANVALVHFVGIRVGCVSGNHAETLRTED